MNRITEHSIEDFAIKLLERMGYEYIYAPSIAHDGENPERSSYEEILLTRRMAEAVRRINPTVPAAAQEDAIKEIQRIHSPELLTNNELFHRLLTEGIKVSYQKDGQQRGDLVWVVDFDTPENNDFIVANQFTVVEDGINKRPDVILFVNDIPLVVIELKNAADENATIKSAFRQIETYKTTIPSLFTYNAFTVISDGLEARAGTLSSGISRFMAWKSADGKEEASHLVSQMETLINGMFNKKTLLDLVRHFIVFEKSKKEDAKTGVTTISTIQKFSPEEGNVYETLSARENIVVIADEAHRTQYGFKAKTVDEKEEHGNVIGKKTVYGFAKYMRDALPNATYIGFTGTPIESTDVNTPAVFGNYIDVYDIAQAVEDGTTVRIYYESRLAKVNLSEEGKKLVEELDDELDGEELTETQKAKAKWTQLEALIGSENRVNN